MRLPKPVVIVLLSALCAEPSMAKDRLLANETLSNNAYLSSPNNLYKFIMQQDGSLVLYRHDGSIRYRMAKYGTHAIMQSDGNFVEYQGTTPLWATNTMCPCPWPFYLRLHDNGDLAIEWISPTGDMGGGVWGIGPDPEPTASKKGVRDLTPPGSPPTSLPNYPVPSSYAY